MAQQTLNTPRETTHQRIADALEDIVDKIVDTSSASNIDYDNTESGLNADKVQGAVDELALAGFVTNTVNNLVNYYLKSETYNKTEVDSLITAVKNSRFEVVSTLPTTDIKTNVIYLVPKLPTQTSNAKDEYINLDGTSSGWEKIGDTEVDLSGYVTTTALNTALSNYTTTANLTNLLDNKVDKVEGKDLSTNDYTDADKNKLAGIEANANKTVVDSAMNDYSTNPLQNRVVNAFLNEKTDISNFNALTQEIELFNTYDLTNDVEISVFANDTYKRASRFYESHIPNLDGEYSVSLGDKTFTETCTFTIANEGKSITEVFHTNHKYILGAKLLKAENDEVGDAHVIADVVTLIISKDAPYTTTFDPSFEHPPVTGVLTLKVSVKPDEKYVNKENTGGPSEYAYWGSYNGSDLLINNPILTYSETTFGQPKVSGNPVTINDAAEANLVECVAKVEAVQEGSGDPSPENIRPISGWDEVNVGVSGVNIWDEQTELGIYDQTTGEKQNYTGISRSVNKIRIEGGTQYYLKLGQGLSHVRVFYYTANSYISTIPLVSGLFTPPNNAEYMTFQFSGTTYNHDISINYPSTDHDYHAYKGKTYTIQIGQDVYGGQLDVTRGKMVVDRGYIASYNGETLPSTWISDRDVYASGTSPTTGAQVVYELATPTTIQLTPQQIRLLKGTNNISCNTGDLSIKYYPDNVLGQLKGDIEDEYDDRVETLETQVQELQPSLIFMSRERRDITSDLSRLSTAVAEQNLPKYGYKIGDYFTGASGYTYILADYNTFKGTSTPYCISTNHIGIVVDTHQTSQWHSGDASNVGYNGSVLNTFLKGTVLDTIKTDFKALFGGSTGLEHLIAHSKLFTTALANWGWQANQYISALTCTQIDAGSQWTANGFQEGEASKSLELFRKHKWTEIFESRYPWLRNLSNYSGGSDACYANGSGRLDGNCSVAGALYVVGLIIFH